MGDNSRNGRIDHIHAGEVCAYPYIALSVLTESRDGLLVKRILAVLVHELGTDDQIRLCEIRCGVHIGGS